MKETRKTVAGLAKELGLSTATVSRALHGDPSVQPDTAKRVLEAAEGFDIKRRRSSAEVRGGNAALIVAANLSNPITLGFIEGLRVSLSASGINGIIALTDYDGERECEGVEYAQSNGMTAVFLLNAIESPRLISLIRSSRIPVVLINRYLRGLETDVVMIDNYRCGWLAADYLIWRRHERIAHVAGPETSVTCRDRTRGFLDRMAEAGLDGRRFLFFGDRTWDAGVRFAEKWLGLPEKARPTALFSTTGLMAAGTVTALRRAGIRVPEQLSVIINDDYSQSYMPYPVDFTSYGRDPVAMGRTAAELLAARTADHSRPPERIVLPPVLTEYNSVLYR
ncbi:MAG: LacI family DNA-binding transcriptional regulator [Clostridia bacterium]|nr:LacI family DNA-binding transcriptional regulator [Clostridia bacterium]